MASPGACDVVEHLRLLQGFDEDAGASPSGAGGGAGASASAGAGRARAAGDVFPRRGDALRQPGTVRQIAGGAVALVLFAGLAALLLATPTSPAVSWTRATSTDAIQEVAEEDVTYGCGLVGWIPGISQDGVVAAETQRLINGIRGSSTLNLITYWNWNLAPDTQGGQEQHLSKDFLFVPEQWGATPVEEKYLRTAGDSNFLDGNGKVCPATMSTLFLGMNEPDIIGSCMGDMFGTCTVPCTDESVNSGNCPAAHLTAGPIQAANAKGECNCWQFSHSTGVGFWPVKNCSAHQPLPTLWSDSQCVTTVMSMWKQTAASAVKKGYKFLSTPLVAMSVDYARQFIATACTECHDISCGCPVYVGLHFYAYDCMPDSLGGYAGFKQRLDAIGNIMMDFPFVKGAIVNEVGMLNCAADPAHPAICVPDSGKYPASSALDHGCPSTPDLPEGLATYLDALFNIVISARTRDGRPIVKGFSWFNMNMDGGTYNQQLFNEDGTVNKVGEAYMRNCDRWGRAQHGALPARKLRH